MAIFISDKLYLRSKTVTRVQNSHYRMVKGSIHQKNITIIYAPNFRVPKHTKQVLTQMKEEKDSNTIKVGDFSASLSIMDRSDRK